MTLVHAVACSCKIHEENKVCAKINLKHFFVFTFREGFGKSRENSPSGYESLKRSQPSTSVETAGQAAP